MLRRRAWADTATFVALVLGLIDVVLKRKQGQRRRSRGGIVGTGATLGRDHDGADIHCGCPSFSGARHVLKQTAASEEEPVQEQVLLTRTVVRGELTMEQPYPAGLEPMEWSHTGAVCEGLQPAVRTHAGSWAQCEEEGMAGRKHYGLTAAVSHFPAPVLLGEVEELGM
ncbi:hypothetical protein TURU_049704 [Turdus rufiventris]|nr:hypothetical protein TURU_049704 [Turdus rufiventris]